jgi:Rieske Fe-S protein
MRVGRREALKQGVGLGLSWGLAARTARGQTDSTAIRPKEGDLLVKADDPSSTPLSPDDIPRDAAQTMAWALDPVDGTVRNGSRLNRVLLLRFDPAALSPETQSRAADGVVAYTAICTHTGCDVVEWLTDQHLLHCPCHFSKFDPTDGARIVGGPAPRSLPALPLALHDGRLTVARPFTTRVGFEPA